MATKNLLNIDWENCEDDFYDEFIEQETTRKLKSKTKDRDFSPSKNSKRNTLSNKMSKKDFTEDILEPELTMPSVKKEKTDISPVNDSVKKEKNILPENLAPKKPIVLGENTREIKGNKIDFDRLVNIEKIEGEFKGNQTFGIKFLFKGNKGLFRIIWYGRNIFERDHAYQEYYNFWKSLGY